MYLLKIFKSRFSILFSLFTLYITLSLLLRVGLLLYSVHNIDFTVANIMKILFLGFSFDITTGLFFITTYNIFLLALPKKWIGSLLDKTFTYCYCFIVLLLMYFSLMAEIPFWDEFGVRFNFIAVDYLIYTYEVITNINQSYPLPLIIGILLILIVLSFYLFQEKKFFLYSFTNKMPFLKRLIMSVSLLILTFSLGFFLKNNWADNGNNLTVNELGKNGVFSFFAAFRSNELDYGTFYPTINQRQAYLVLRKKLLQNNQHYLSKSNTEILRETEGETLIRPNIILLTIESFSAEFLKSFGNTQNLTPNYDALSAESIFFTNLFATGTRTVRGMEALTLSIPPTPGNSIVRRPDNQHLFSVATIVRNKNYHPYFIYGGDGYFDNMNNFFGGQGFDIVDRDRGNTLSEDIATKRYRIPDSEVSFENAWGVCDEDLYKQSIKYADINFEEKKPFFQFVMTTSNHKPYTFPNGKINLPQGERDAAVKYTDYALGKFIALAKTKAWFKNTVFVIVADHCASSAGKWEININKHHIPAIIYNLNQKPEKIDRLMSQIDLMPTLFGYLGWDYNTALYGKDINQTKIGEERAFIGNYRTLGLLKGDIFTQINDRKKTVQYNFDQKSGEMREDQFKNSELTNETISYYQTASERFKEGKMKEIQK